MAIEQKEEQISTALKRQERAYCRGTAEDEQNVGQKNQYGQ